MIPSYQRLFLLMSVLLLSAAQSSLSLARVIVRVAPLTAETKELGFAKANLARDNKANLARGKKLSDQEKLDLRNKVLKETGKELAIEADDVDSSNSNFFILMSYERRTRQSKIRENLSASFMLASSYYVMNTNGLDVMQRWKGWKGWGGDWFEENNQFPFLAELFEALEVAKLSCWVAAELGIKILIGSGLKDKHDEYIEVLEVNPAPQSYLNKVTGVISDLVINQYLAMTQPAILTAVLFYGLKFNLDTIQWKRELIHPDMYVPPFFWLFMCYWYR